MLKQNLNLKLSQKLSPQQIQLMNIIQLSSHEFEQKVKQELEENITLDDSNLSSTEESLDVLEPQETNVDDYLDDEIPSFQQSNTFNIQEQYPIPEAETSLHQYLNNQLNAFDINDESKAIAEFLIGSIDDSGYIRFTIDDIADDLAFKQNIIISNDKIKNVLTSIIHQMEPAGIGAQNLRECLLIQLQQLPKTANVASCIQIISEDFELFSKKHYDQIAKKYKLEEAQLRTFLHIIEKLNPKPGAGYSTNNKFVEHVIPDFILHIEDESIELELNSKNSPALYITPKYRNMLETYKNSKIKSPKQKEAIQFVKQKLDAAKWFIDAINQRQHTLMITMKAILDYQKDYFMTGDLQSIRPMVLKDIATRIKMDVSTVSRVVNSKYVSSPYGVKRLKDFFSESIKAVDGEDISIIRAKDILQNIIEKEDKKNPLTDDQLVETLNKQGINIARRTVAKYRELLNIPVARLRKKL